VFRNHQQVIKSRSLVTPLVRGAGVRWPSWGRTDRFAALVAEVVSDPDSPFNLDRYLWVLEERPAWRCGSCGVEFDPWCGYGGDPGRGCAWRYCSRPCRERAAWAGRSGRARLVELWERGA
jgi:hypothetical protein